MEDVKNVLKTIDTMQSEGASVADIGRFAKSTGYDLPALSEAFKTYKKTGEVEIAGAGTSLLQGLTFGFSEEIGGIAAAVTGGDYDEYVKAQRNKMKLYQQQNPIISTVFEVVGSLPTMLIPGVNVAKGVTGATKMATAVRSAATAGGQGALYGFGTGEGFEGSVENALSTGAVSAGVGAALSPLTRLTASTRMRQSLTPEQEAVEQITKRVSPETVDAFQSPSFQQQAGMALADTGDEAARYLRGIRGLDSQASQLIDETLDSRWQGQYQRVTKLINGAFDNDPQLAKAMSGDLKQMKDTAGLAYTKLYNDFIDLKSDSVGRVIKADDTLRDYWDEALGFAIKEARKDPVKLKALQSLPKSSDITPDTPLPMEVLDKVKKYLDDDIGRALRGTDNKAGSRFRALNATKQEYLELLDGATDNAYAKVRNNFADPARMEDALELGKSATKRNVSADEIRQQLQQYNPQEAKAYMAGVLQSIYSTINTTGFSRDVLKNLVGTPEMTAKLRALMPNEAAWKRFQAAMANEAKQIRTKRLVSGGSNTADKLTDINAAESLLDDAVSLAFDPSLGAVSGTAMARVSKFAQDFVRKIASNAETRSLQAKMLLETDPEAKRKLAMQITEARRALADRALESSKRGAATATVAGDVAGIAASDVESEPLRITVTKPLPNQQAKESPYRAMISIRALMCLA